MKINHSIGSIAFLFITPLVTGLSASIAPSSAAIIAGSAAEVSIDNFSHRPIETATSTNTNTQTIANQGIAIGEANAEAVFISNCQELLAANLSQSKVQGEGSKYAGLAQSQSSILGDFSIDAKETFSFNFQTVLNLFTSVDDSKSEGASARGNISFSLIDTVSNILLDSFQIDGSLQSFNFPNLSLLHSNSFHPTEINFDFVAQGNAKNTSFYAAGVYSRTFETATNLRLVEVKNNLAEAVAEPVPEPTTVLGTLMFLGFLAKGRKLQYKLSQVKAKI